MTDSDPMGALARNRRKPRRKVHDHAQAQARRRRQIAAGTLGPDNGLASICPEHSLMIAGTCRYCDR